MTERDLNELGIWRIAIPSAGAAGGVNAWAIEDVNGAMALYDCGDDSSESLAALGRGLGQAGASVVDVRRVFLSHAHPEHAGGARRPYECSGGRADVYASRAEVGALVRQGVDGVLALSDGARIRFRHFAATVLAVPGHTPGTMCLYAEQEQLLFSSDFLLFDAPQRLLAERGCAAGAQKVRAAFRSSLHRIAARDVRVVLPGRGAPFAGHRRVVREALSNLE